MALSWNEIKDRALKFSNEWKDDFNEEAEAKSFLEAFFNVFGISRKKVATFEHKVKKLNDHDGYIDLFWKGTLLVEMKSEGKNLEKAYKQAREYLQTVPQHEIPKYILISDFKHLKLYDLEDDSIIEFTLNEFVKNVQHFGFIAGYQKRVFKEQDPVNIKAAELMGKLHDKLKEVGYDGHNLELYLVRLLFCLFADDTTIFDKDTFIDFIEQRTSEDGSDLAGRLSELFYILNTSKDKRLKNIDEQLNQFPYVNGKLFEENLPPASFDTDMRRILIECCTLNWGLISPAIFGSMFQSVMNPKERRNLGAHYTSEKNIMKVIKPLFLDELWEEFESVKGSKPKMQKFHDKIALLRFLDPACGSGNFLIIAYRELRKLEIEIIKELQKGQMVTDVFNLIKVDVDRFYGIEYEEFAAQIAQVAMWLIDHQMNMLVSEAFGEYYVRLPLKKSPVIVHGNALRTDWQSLIDPVPFEKKEQVFDYIMGNPPFIGKTYQTSKQKEDMILIAKGVDGSGVLDYVTAWFLRASSYLQSSHNTKAAFVSTNSIAQGEQVGLLWKILFIKYNVKIHFAYRPFKWQNEARGNAGVHVVIIGFGLSEPSTKKLFEISETDGKVHEANVKSINPYLIEGSQTVIERRTTPICKVPKMVWGNKPVDGGHLLLEKDEYIELISKDPLSKKYLKRFYGGQEFIQNKERWCLWLVDATPDTLKKMPMVLERINKVKQMRLASIDSQARKLAEVPALFRDTANPKTFIAVPEVSSERRKYIPIGFLDEQSIASNTLQLIPNAGVFEFGILTSIMHMTWVAYVCGRLESRFRYSNSIVYNNYPWPENPNSKQIAAIEKAAQKVLGVRAEFPNSSLADLYDPLTMPLKLVKAHQELDNAVDLAYRPQPFTSETKRMEFLFELYEKYTADLFTGEKTVKKKKKADA
jgi:type I restriction-modification system DNA methylase subunit